MNESKREPFNWPRRGHSGSLVPAETKLHELIKEVEGLGASDRLTDCVAALGEASDALADHLEDKCGFPSTVTIP